MLSKVSNLYRMRVELSAEKGALGRLGIALESIGGSIITIDLQDIDAHRAVDDLVVQFASTHPTPEAVIETLEASKAGSLKYWAPVNEAIDPVLRTIRWACSIFGAGSALEDEVTRVIAEICGTADAWLVGPDDDRFIEAAEAAITKHRAISREVEEVPELLRASFEGPACLLAVPDAALAPDYVAIVARPAGQSFSATEMDRVAAILAMYRQSKLSADRSSATTTGPWFSSTMYAE